MPPTHYQPPISLLRGLALVGAGLALFVLADLAIGLSQPDPPSLAEELPIPLEFGDVYLLGNSMFKTGIDIDQLQSILPAESVKFSYHDGYYSNLWYLMVKNAIIPDDDEPAVLVWGFRPTYAIQPAFQKRDSPDIVTFRLDEEPFWEDLVSSRGRVPVPSGDSFMDEVGRTSTIHSGRDDFQQWLHRAANIATTSLLEAADVDFTDTLRAALIDGDDSAADVLLRTLTSGRVQLTEELVVDDGEQFITGPEVTFAQSFVPHTADLVAEAGIPQLVLIFKPVAEAEGRLDPAATEFAAQAAAYFEARGVSYINFLEDESVVRAHFAKGDHYNEDGRRNVTSIVGAELVRMLEALNSTES